MNRKTVATLLMMWISVACTPPPWLRGAEHSDMSIKTTPEHEIRYTSGRTIYVEALVGDQLVGRYWTADGRAHLPHLRSPVPVFELHVEDDTRRRKSTSWSTGWRWVAASELPKTDRGARHVVVELSSTILPIKLEVHTLLDGTPVLTRWLEITNTSKEPVVLTALSPWSGGVWLGDGELDLGDQLDNQIDPKHFGLGWFKWRPLPVGTTSRESVKGIGEDDPFFVVRNEAKGKYLIGHLAWSANWRMVFDRKQDGLLWKIGPSAIDPLRVIAPGETIKTPAVHLGLVEGDFDTAVQAMHDHIRQFVLPLRKPERSYLIQYSVPGDGGFHTGKAFNETNVMKCMDVAAAVGAELFIMDQGWWDVYGEWVPSPARFPRGLKPLVEYARQKGLLFGLYAEVEGGRGDWKNSKVFKEHPDWFVLGEINAIDLSRPEAAAHLESELTGIIERYGIDLYRHDYCLGDGFWTYEGTSTRRGGFLENNYWRYYDAYYSILDRTRAKYPDLILQMCSCGGHREDLDMMSRVHETYTVEGSVNKREFAQNVLPAYSGKTVALPPEVIVMGLRHMTLPTRISGARTVPREHLDTLLRATFTLSTPWVLYGPAPSLEELDPQRCKRYLHYANLYKKFIRPVLPTCKVYHHAPVSSRGGVTSSPWFAMEYVAPDRARGWATIIRLGESKSETYLFKARGLDPGRTYRATFDSTGKTTTIEGRRLLDDSISIHLESLLSSELVLFEAQ